MFLHAQLRHINRKIIINKKRKKYRIKATINPDYVNPCYKVQVLRWFGWVDVKVFYDPYDRDFARREAEELLDKLNEE